MPPPPALYYAPARDGPTPRLWRATGFPPVLPSSRSPVGAADPAAVLLGCAVPGGELRAKFLIAACMVGVWCV